MRISAHYLELNRQLHASNERFGDGGARWAKQLEELAGLLNTTSILDYGCGKGELALALPGLPVREYDPAIRGKDDEPAPADIVVCTDVLEHIEPECLQNVLDHIQLLTLRMAILVVHIGPAVKILQDGRNAHLSQYPAQWWTHEINRRFEIANLQYPKPTLFFLVRKSDWKPQ